MELKPILIFLSILIMQSVNNMTEDRIRLKVLLGGVSGVALYITTDEQPQ